MEPSPSTSTGTPLRLLWRLFNNRNLRRVVGVRRGPAPFRNHATCSLHMFFAHQDEHPAQTGERVLHQGRRSEVAVDARRIEQSLDHQRLRLPLRVEHLHQFLVWIRTGIRTRLRVGGRIARFCHDISNSGIGPCGRTPCDTAILLPFPGRVGAWESVSRVDAASSGRVAILPRGASFPARARTILGALPIFSSERHFCVVAFFRSSGRMTVTIGATPGRVASSKIVGREKGDTMNMHQQAGQGSSFPMAEQETLREREEEARKIRRLQLMISMVMSVISQDSNLTVEEASELAAGAKRAALAMFPDKELAYDLLYKPRLQRLMRERFRLQ